MAPKCGNVACLGGVRRARVRADAPRRRLRRQYPNGRRFPRPREPSSPQSRPPHVRALPQETPLLRKGWVPAGASEATPLCNACGLLCAPRPPRVPARTPRFFPFVKFKKRSAVLLQLSSLPRFGFGRFRKKKALRDDRRGNRARRRSTRPFPLNAPAFPRSHAFSDANDPRRYKRGWFCSWCSTVYRKREEEDDPALGAAGPGAKLWVGCDRCDRWSHLSCELANDAACLGTGREVPFEAAPALCFPSDVTPRDRVDHAFCVDQKTDTKTETVRRAYHCPSCRERDGEKKKNNRRGVKLRLFRPRSVVGVLAAVARRRRYARRRRRRALPPVPARARWGRRSGGEVRRGDAREPQARKRCAG